MNKILWILFCCCIFSTMASQNIGLDSVSLFFKIDSFSLNPNHRNTIDSFIQIHHIKNVSRYDIRAYADYLGNPTYNQKLSEKRANAVNTYLTNQISNIQIKKEVLAFGESFSTEISDNRLGTPKDRRVDFIISSGSKRRIGQDTTIEISLDTLNIDQLKAGDKLILRNLNFIGGRHVLIRESIPELIRLKDIMLANPKLAIAIEGHICCRYDGSDGFDIDAKNYKLSINRAKNIYDYLILHGIDKDRLTYRGFGSALKIYPQEKTERERTLNRRVEMKVIRN